MQEVIAMSKCFATAAIILALSSASAFSWETTVDGPDVFGKVKVVAAEDLASMSMVVQCDSETELFVAFIFRKKEFQEINEIPAKLYVKTTDASPSIYDAVFRNWNDNYAGVVAAGRSNELVQLIETIGNAKAKIEVGYEVGGNRESASFSSHRSKQAMKTVFGKCKLPTNSQ
jgi:hypothetical protein